MLNKLSDKKKVITSDRNLNNISSENETIKLRRITEKTIKQERCSAYEYVFK